MLHELALGAPQLTQKTNFEAKNPPIVRMEDSFENNLPQDFVEGLFLIDQQETTEIAVRTLTPDVRTAFKRVYQQEGGPRLPSARNRHSPEGQVEWFNKSTADDRALLDALINLRLALVEAGIEVPEKLNEYVSLYKYGLVFIDTHIKIVDGSYDPNGVLVFLEDNGGIENVCEGSINLQSKIINTLKDFESTLTEGRGSNQGI